MALPVEMSLHKKSRRFDIAFDDGSNFASASNFFESFSFGRGAGAYA